MYGRNKKGPLDLALPVIGSAPKKIEKRLVDLRAVHATVKANLESVYAAYKEHAYQT